MSAERRQLPYALLLSLLIHALVLSLTFLGGPGWLPGFFWQDRRIEATDLSVVLVPAQITAAEPGARSSVNGPMQASIGQPVAGEVGPDALRISRADFGPKGRSDRAQGQADATSQAEAATQASAGHRDRCFSCEYAVAHGRLRGRRDHNGA